MLKQNPSWHVADASRSLSNKSAKLVQDLQHCHLLRRTSIMRNFPQSYQICNLEVVSCFQIHDDVLKRLGSLSFKSQLLQLSVEEAEE